MAPGDTPPGVGETAVDRGINTLLLAAGLPLCAMSIKQMVRFNQQQA
ncbi:hypothetical protein [Amphritea atlantica]|nr:hypothetical protein [Amphritea atlantica]